MIYGLRIEFNMGDDEKIVALLSIINDEASRYAKICKLDCLERIVSDYKTFENAVLSIETIGQLVRRLSEAILSIRMRYYLSETDIHPIYCYQDFVNSSCFLLVWAYDEWYYDIYCKNETTLKNISERLKKETSTHSDYIDQYEDISTQM